jgi:small conductance mechanosensitive channel
LDTAQLNEDVTIFANQLAEWAASALPNLLGALAILAAGWWLSGVAARAMGHMVETRPYVDPTLKGVLTQIVRWGLLAITAVAALSQLGFATTSLLAALGAIGLAIGLALQGTLANIAAGIMLLWLRPLRVGDYVSAGDVAGTVKEVGLFATTVVTFEGVFTFVPNSSLWNTKITNFTRSTPRMVRETFGIAYEDDIAKARKVLLKVVTEDERVHADPPPVIYVSSLGDNAVALELRAWTDGSNWVVLRFDVIERGKLALDAAGISIPFPQRDLHIKNMPSEVTKLPPPPKKRKPAA